MTDRPPYAWRVARGRWIGGWAVAVLVPLALLVLLRVQPRFDVSWENHPAHFWLVLAASAVAVALGYSVAFAARSRRDARLFLISLAFIASAFFLGLHALATPGVLVGPNAGFELATPIGLVLGGLFMALSALELRPLTALFLIRHSVWFVGALAAVAALWAILSLAQVPPLDDSLQGEELSSSQVILAAGGIVFYAAASWGYLRLFLRRRASFVFAVMVAAAFLAEAMIVIVFARNWQISWWEWHVLMVGAFLLMAASARREWHEERFSPLYLDRTLAGTREASVIFADLEGYTTFSENSKPAEVAEMLNSYFSRIVPLIERMGGEVHQFIGDAIMVVFNKSGDQPDHAVIAARAALKLQGTAEEVAGDHPRWPRFRVGVNSGEVLAGVLGGERGHRIHGLVGDSVNLAARLESAARPGDVLIGAGTYERLPPGAAVESVPPMQVKGKTETVTAYVLRALPDGADRG